MNHETTTKARMSDPLGIPSPGAGQTRAMLKPVETILADAPRLAREHFLAATREALRLAPVKPARKSQPPPDNRRTRAEAAPKCTVQQINELIKRVRVGEPLILPEGNREKRYYDPTLSGFYIRLLNSGVASWVLQYKRLGRPKKIKAGDVKGPDRLEAIKRAKQLLAKVELEMLDPLEARRERMRANKVTFATVVPLFLERKKSLGQLKSSTAEDWNRYLTDYYFKLLHHLPIDEITTEQIQTQVDIIATQSGNRTAEVCCTVMRVLFKWADKTGKLPEGHRNPMDNVQPPARSPSRARVLTDDEIRLILKTCDAWEALAIQEHQFKETMSKGPRKGHLFHPDYPRAVKLLFFTGCRRQEIGGLELSEGDVDNAGLVSPGVRSENKRDLCNPLCDMAVEILR